MNKRSIYTTIFNRFTNPCVIIDVLADVWVEEVIKVFVAVFVTNARADMAIDKVSGDVTIGIVSSIAVELLIGGLLAAITTL